MNTTVTCPTCSKQNEASRLFCSQCGKKIDHSQIRFGSRPARKLWNGVRRLVRLLILGALLAVLGLLVWPATPEGQLGTDEDGDACFDKLAALYQAIQTDRHRVETVTEAEANAYLFDLVADAVPPPQSAATLLEVRGVNLQFTPHAVIVHVSTAWRGVQLTYELTGTPRLQDDQFVFAIDGFALGHLPLPGPLQQQLADRVAPLFEHMERERYVLDHLTAIELEEGSIRFFVHP